MKPLVRILALLSLVLLLPACGTQVERDAPTAEAELGFVFEVDPGQGLVTLGVPGTTVPPSDLEAQAEGAQLVNDQLVLSSMNHWFVGDRLYIEAVFTNVGADDLGQPFSFERNPATSNVVSSVEPTVSDADLGGDGVLSPGEATSSLTFEVRHRYEPFRYVVDAYAVVTPDTPEPMGKIAFESNRDGNDKIYVMNADGTEQTNVTNTPMHRDRHPRWSPDGTKIAFWSGWPDGTGYSRYAIYVMNADGTHQRILGEGEDDYYIRFGGWSPDSTRVAFTIGEHSSQKAYVNNVDGTNQVKLGSTDDTNDVAGLRWSPDSSKIVFASYQYVNDIYTVNPDGSNLTNLTNTPEAYERYPTWSPDGTKIAFLLSYLDGNDEIYVMNADGSNPTSLIDQPADLSNPVWSPDGSMIAFTSNRDDGNGEIYVMNADGSDLVTLSSQPVWLSSPVWSPDGTKIAFASYWDRNQDIQVINADGSNLVNLTDHPATDWFPVWSPDGTKIAFASYRDGNSEIYVVNPDGTNLTNLTNNPGEDMFPAWQPLLH